MEPREKERLDRWLDKALHEYGNAEPQLGLETRILAGLAAEKESFASRWGWRWVFASAVTTVATMVALWLGFSTNKPSQSPTKLASNPTLVEQKADTANAQFGVKHKQLTIRTSAQQKTQQQFAKSEPATTPKLSQFPSLRPLSTQEQLLVLYARKFPQQALEVAQAQVSAEAQREREELTTEQLSEMGSSHQE